MSPTATPLLSCPDRLGLVAPVAEFIFAFAGSRPLQGNKTVVFW